MQRQTVLLADPRATEQLGRELATLWLNESPIRPILLLSGDLGAGKTSLVQGIAQGLGIAEPITSPSFALAQHYFAGLAPLVHLDLYRLESPAAADELFAQEEEEAVALGALMAVEWPSRLSFVPHQSWTVLLELIQDTEPAAGRVATVW